MDKKRLRELSGLPLLEADAPKVENELPKKYFEEADKAITLLEEVTKRLLTLQRVFVDLSKTPMFRTDDAYKKDLTFFNEQINDICHPNNEKNSFNYFKKAINDLRPPNGKIKEELLVEKISTKLVGMNRELALIKEVKELYREFVIIIKYLKKELDNEYHAGNLKIKNDSVELNKIWHTIDLVFDKLSKFQSFVNALKIPKKKV